ncbi:unnamed protein product, partial [Brenthis ino]
MSKQAAKSSSVRKSGGQIKPNPPEPNMDILKEEAKTVLKTAKQHMESSGNLKTTIKEAVLSSLNRLYEIVDLLNDSRLSLKNNLEIIIANRAKEKEQTQETSTIAHILKVMEAIRDQNLITKTTQAALLLITEEMQTIKDQQAAQLKTLEISCKAPAKLVEAAEEQNSIKPNSDKMSKPTVKASTSRKSGSQPKPNPPEPDMDSLKDEAKAILKTAKQQMDSSGNLKTTIKDTLITSLQRLYEIIDLLNDSRLAVKNNLEIILARRKTEQDQTPPPQILKVLEAVKEQSLITKTTQAALLLITEEITGMKDLQAAQQRTLELMIKAPAKLAEAAEEQSKISGNIQQAIESLKEEIIETKEIQTKERPNNDDRMDEINGKLEKMTDIIQTQNEVAKETIQEVKETRKLHDIMKISRSKLSLHRSRSSEKQQIPTTANVKSN